MRLRHLLTTAALLALTLPAAAVPAGTDFTYQGRLNSSGVPASGIYDFTFTLLDAPTDGTTIGATLYHEDVSVDGGLFTVRLDFGAAAFTGDARWLEIGIRPQIISRTIPSGQGSGFERSELLLFHSSDNNNGFGPDYITLRAPALRLQTFNNAAITDPANNAGSNDRLVISPTGDVTISQNLTVNGQAYKPGGGSWATPSDAALKKNIATIGNALDRLASLRGVTYQWNDPTHWGDQTGTMMGMIADEVEKVFPEWIKRASDGTRLLEITGFEGLTVEAFKQIRADNATLHRQNQELKTRLGELESRLLRLEKHAPHSSFAGNTSAENAEQ